MRVAPVRATIPKKSVTEKEIGKCLDICQETVDMSVDEQGISGRRGKSTILHLAKLYTPSADLELRYMSPWKATQTCGYQGAHAFGMESSTEHLGPSTQRSHANLPSVDALIQNAYPPQNGA